MERQELMNLIQVKIESVTDYLFDKQDELMKFLEQDSDKKRLEEIDATLSKVPELEAEKAAIEGKIKIDPTPIDPNPIKE